MWIEHLIKTCKEFSDQAFKRGNPYNLKKLNQDQLVKEISSKFEKTILKPLHRSRKEHINTHLINELNTELDELKKNFKIIDNYVERHNQILEKREVSLYSAFIEAYDPEKLRPIFEKIISIENENCSEDKTLTIELTWSEYYNSAYNEFFRDLKKLLPDGPHSEFYKKRVLDKNTQLSKTESINNQNESNEINNVSVTEHLPTQQSRPSPAPTQKYRDKSARLTKSAPEPKAEPVQEAESVRKPEPTKPKISLLEQMAVLSEFKEQKTAIEHKQLSYPPIFKNKNWKKYWSNAKPPTGSAWKEFLWNCNSIGKDYLMETKSREKLICDLDVNQDFAVVNAGEDSLRAILFDGVSQSRAPRQWAECLAKSYIEQKLNIDKLMKHSTEVEEWHSASLVKWNQWIEQHYLPQRQHLPEWRLRNEVASSFTTFVVLEVDSKMVRLTNLGDSAIFCKLKTGEIKSLPSTYNHLLRPKNISTQKLYESSDMEFTSFSIDDVDSVLACTDSIADYIFDSDEAKMNLKYIECLNALSTKGDKFEFMSKMITKGPSNGGWLEDDVTFFSLVRNEQSVSKQMEHSIEDVNETAIDGEAE